MKIEFYAKFRKPTPADEYMDTVKRLEPDISAIDAAAYYASAAISQKRIADSMGGIHWCLYGILLQLAILIGLHFIH